MEEELEAVGAIYCTNNEFQILQKGSDCSPTIVSIDIQCHCPTEDFRPVIKLTLTLDSTYPSTVPRISLQCDETTRERISSMKSDLMTFANELASNPMMMDLIMWLQENGHKYIESSGRRDGTSGEGVETDLVSVLLHLDHMRAKGKYVKTIQKWTEELGLCGRLLFHDNIIFILLQGPRNDIKEYISRQKTVNIDVDSKGRSCKERMLRIVAETELSVSSTKIQGFEVKDATSLDDMQTIFTEFGLRKMFENHVLSFYKRT